MHYCYSLPSHSTISTILFLNRLLFEFQDGRFRTNRDSRKGSFCLFSYTGEEVIRGIFLGTDYTNELIMLDQVGRKVAKERVVEVAAVVVHVAVAVAYVELILALALATVLNQGHKYLLQDLPL